VWLTHAKGLRATLGRETLNSMALRRQALLAVDRLLGAAEGTWIELRGGRRRRAEGRHVDPSSGRTRRDHLESGGIGEQVWPKVQEALDAGVDRDALVRAVNGVTESSGKRLAEALRVRAPQMHREHRAADRGMQRRMRAVWGPAFDAFYEIWVCVEELGSDLQQLHRLENDPLVAALLGLHARTCLVLCEIHALMWRGFPLGAWARTRSLHETAVIAALLADHGREPGLEDLAERFLLHADIDEARDVELAVLSGATIEPNELDRVRLRRKELQARFGRMFSKDYGWARPLFPQLGEKERLTFDRLEDVANTNLQRLDYRLASHHVHATAWTLELNQLARGGVVHRLTGPTNVGFGEPAEVALASMMVSTSAIVWGVSDRLPDPMNLVALAALRALGGQALELFDEAQEFVNEREERLQARGGRVRRARGRL
jgi:hypothetical protein